MLKGVVAELFGSKKFLVFLVSLIVAAGARFGLAVDPTTVAEFLGFASVLIVGQGVTDIGKPAAQHQARLAAAIAMTPGEHRETALRALAGLPPANTSSQAVELKPVP